MNEKIQEFFQKVRRKSSNPSQSVTPAGCLKVNVLGNLKVTPNFRQNGGYFSLDTQR